MDSTFELDLQGLLGVLEVLPDFIAILDRDGVILYLNRLEEGYRMEDVIGTPTRDLLDPQFREGFDAALEAAFSTEGTPDQEYGITTPTGAGEFYRGRMFPLRSGGRTTAVVLVATGRAHLTALEQELLQLQRLLPICAWCHRILREDGRWEPIEVHLNREAPAGVTHAICPDCEEGELDEF